MNKSKYLSLALCAALFITSCTDHKKQSSDRLLMNDSALKAAGVTFDTLSLNIHRNLIEGRERPSYDIQIVMPFAQGESQLAQTINQSISQEFLQSESLPPRRAMQHYADSLAQVFTQELTEFYDPDEDMPSNEYTWFVSGNISKNPRPGCIAYSFYVETYLGGAHGSHDIYYLNIDSKTGKRLSKADVFKADKEEELLQAITQRLAHDNGCKNRDELMEKTGITMLGDIYVGQNFTLESEGITFVYNTYEIASYADGTISVFLPYDELKPFLK